MLLLLSLEYDCVLADSLCTELQSPVQVLFLSARAIVHRSDDCLLSCRRLLQLLLGHCCFGKATEEAFLVCSTQMNCEHCNHSNVSSFQLPFPVSTNIIGQVEYLVLIAVNMWQHFFPGVSLVTRLTHRLVEMPV